MGRSGGGGKAGEWALGIAKATATVGPAGATTDRTSASATLTSPMWLGDLISGARWCGGGITTCSDITWQW